MLHCLGVKVKHDLFICGDNKGLINNNTILDILLKNKHFAIIYHSTRESDTVGIVYTI